ncbi:MAG: segregation/condensation protein A [Candidatus Woesearchaeota archaeon]
MEQRIFKLLFENDEVTWQSIIYRLVKEEGMDPWDIDITLLSHRYIRMLKKLKEMDFRISGKVVLAAAILLRLKSTKLVEDDLTALDRLIASTQESNEDFSDEFYSELESEFEGLHETQKESIPWLVPKTPQPRTRKVSIYDLMDALEEALEVSRKRVLRTMPERKIEIPEMEIDITQLISSVYTKIQAFFNKSKEKLFFNQLVDSDDKEDKIMTFIPLLHLVNERKVDVEQLVHFGPIEVKIK